MRNFMRICLFVTVLLAPLALPAQRTESRNVRGRDFELRLSEAMEEPDSVAALVAKDADGVGLIRFHCRKDHQTFEQTWTLTLIEPVQYGMAFSDKTHSGILLRLPGDSFKWVVSSLDSVTTDGSKWYMHDIHLMPGERKVTKAEWYSGDTTVVYGAAETLAAFKNGGSLRFKLLPNTEPPIFMEWKNSSAALGVEVKRLELRCNGFFGGKVKKETARP